MKRLMILRALYQVNITPNTSNTATTNQGRCRIFTAFATKLASSKVKNTPITRSTSAMCQRRTKRR